MTYLRVQDREETAWRVVCPHHGHVFLTQEEYDAQLTAPNSRWACPAFEEGDPEDPCGPCPGVCGAKAVWDDSWYETWMSGETKKPNAPEGCLGCNPDEIGPLLEERGIEVEEVPAAQHGWRDVIVCKKCGQAWLLMPRDGDVGKPVA